MKLYEAFIGGKWGKPRLEYSVKNIQFILRRSLEGTSLRLAK